MQRKIFGYVRTTRKEKNEEEQIDKIRRYCDSNCLEIHEREIIVDTISADNLKSDGYKALVEYENATAEYVFAKFEDSKYGFVIKDAAYYCKGYDPENGVNDDTLLDYVHSYYGYYIDREDIKIEESNDKKLIVSIPASEQVEYDGYSLTEKSTDKRITITIERKTLDFYTDEENGGEAQNLLNVDF